MRCRNFFSAAIRQGIGAWPPFLDNNSWISLFFTLVALSDRHLVFPFHPTSNPLPSFLSVFPHSLFVFFLCPCLPQRFVQPTVVAMAFVCRAAAVVTKAGWALGVTKGRVTLAVTNMALARTEDVNAVRAGTESTAPLVGREVVYVLVALWACMSVSLGWVCGVNTSVRRLSACVCGCA